MRIKFYCILGSGLFMASCSTVYYSPSVHNVPLFEEKEELRVSAHSGSADNVSTIDFQTAYAITNRVAVMANFYNAKANINNSNKLSGTGSLFEGGGGIYIPFGSMFVFETYGVAGIGNSVIRYSDTIHDEMVNRFGRFYIQPSIGITTQYFDVAFSNRVVLLNMYSINGGNTYEKFAADRRSIEAGRPAWLYEYGITLRGGWKYIKLQLQTNFSTFLSTPRFPANRQATTLGLIFSLGSPEKRAFNPVQR